MIEEEGFSVFTGILAAIFIAIVFCTEVWAPGVRKASAYMMCAVDRLRARGRLMIALALLTAYVWGIITGWVWVLYAFH